MKNSTLMDVIRYFSIGISFGGMTSIAFSSQTLPASDWESELSITSVNISELPPDVDEAPAIGAEVLGRTHRILSETELSDLQQRQSKMPVASGSAMSWSDSSQIVDLWECAKNLRAPTNSRFSVTYEIVVPSTQKVYMDLGCNDEASVWVDGRVCFATIGRCDFMRCQHIIPLSLPAGTRKIVIVCKEASPWREIPDDHIQGEWLLEADFFTSSDDAWNAYRSRNLHIVDCPIVPSIEALRVENTIPGGESRAVLMDESGNSAISGKVRADGTIEWPQHQEMSSSLGFLRISDGAIEPILIAQQDRIDELCSKIIGRTELTDEAIPWITRLKVLRSAVTPEMRDSWWARKVVLSLYQSIVSRNSLLGQRICKGFRPARLQMASFRSKVDGTVQYYMTWLRGPSNGPLLTIVILPSVPDSVRPFLESPQVANLREMEDDIDMADTNSESILWPGIVDVDYGGGLCRTEIEECLDSLKLKIGGEPKAVLVGTCSSGIAAIGYAESHKISGLVLLHPMIARMQYAYWGNLPIDNIAFPSSVLDDEQTDDRLAFLAQTPTMLIFNSRPGGHGDRSASKYFCKVLKAAGGDIVEQWPQAKFDFTWGERLRCEVHSAYAWANLGIQGDDGKELESQGSRQEQPSNVKMALLKGFQIDAIEDPRLDAWVGQWQNEYVRYRGAKCEIAGNGEARATSVTGKLLSIDDLTAIKEGRFIDGKVINGGKGAIACDAEICGFRLVQDTHHARVEVFGSKAVAHALPRIDFLIQGCCKGAIWCFCDGKWALWRMYL